MPIRGMGQRSKSYNNTAVKMYLYAITAYHHPKEHI